MIEGVQERGVRAGAWQSSGERRITHGRCRQCHARLRLISVNGRQTIQSANRRQGTIDVHGASMVLYRWSDWAFRHGCPGGCDHFPWSCRYASGKLPLYLRWTRRICCGRVVRYRLKKLTRLPMPASAGRPGVLCAFARVAACRTYAGVEIVRPAPPVLPRLPKDLVCGRA